MTMITRFSLTAIFILACTLVCIAQEQPKEAAANASTTENAVGPIDGEGTTGKIPKFTGTNTIADSIITESSGRLGVSTPVAPQAKFHVHVPGLPALPGGGTNATPLLQTSGGKGGNTTGADAGTQTGGAGASIFLMAGQGGDAAYGSIRGSGGSITLQPGAVGGGTGFSGVSGNVLLAPNGIGRVGINTNNPTVGKLHVDGGTGVAVFAYSSSGGGVHGESTDSFGVSGLSVSDYGVAGQSYSNDGVRGFSFSGDGVHGSSNSGEGVRGFSDSGNGIFGSSNTGNAGQFVGKVLVNGNLTLTGDESFGSSRRQMINLYSTTYGIGVQSNTQYFRTNSGFAWFKGGVHDNAPNNSGGGTLQMRLDSAGNLHTLGAVNPASDRQLKANFTAVNSRSILDKLSTLPIQMWNYKAEDKAVRHIGPVAQDFKAAFGVGVDDKHIATVDADGVALAAIQGLYQQNQELKKELRQLQAQLLRQQAQLNQVRRTIKRKRVAGK